MIKEILGKLIDKIKTAEEIAKLKKERQSQYYREFKKKNPNYYKELNEKNRLENFEKYLFDQTKAYAKKNKIEFNILLTDVVIPEICPLIGQQITKNVGDGKILTNPCIFRINESIGYIKGNILVTCILANHYRSLGSVQQAQLFIDNIKKFY